MAERSVSVSLRIQVSEYVAGLRTAAGQTKQFSDELAKSHTASKKLSDGMLVAGGALAGGFLYAAKAAADFDQAMSNVGAVTDTNAAGMETLRAAALAAGKATQYSATQAAKAEEELAKAGISAADIIGGGLTGALSLAAAGSLDLGTAADIAAKAMNTFGLSGRDVPHIADVLAAAANKSATDVEELGLALKQGGLAARNSGLSLEQTTGVLSAFADNALSGSDAGTSLKTMLQAIAAPSKKASETMRELGINAYDAGGNFVGISTFAGILKDKLGGLTQQERNAALATIFGSDATRAATVLYKEGADGIDKYVNAVNDSGAAADTARKKTDNLAGDVERLKGSLETLAIESGSGANGGLRILTKALDGVVESIGVIPQSSQAVLTVLAGLGGAALVASAGWLKLRDKVNEMQASLSGMGPAGEKAAGALGKVTSAGGRLLITLAAMQVASAAWAAATADAAPQMQQLQKDLATFGETGKLSGEALRLFGKNLELLKYDIKTMGTGFWAQAGNGFAGFIEGITGTGQVFDQSLTNARTRIGELDQSLSGMVSSGHGDEAAKVFERIRQEAEKQDISLHDLQLALPNYMALLNGASASEAAATAAASAHTLQNNLLAGSLRDAIDAAGGLKAAFDQLNGAQLTVNETAIAAEAAIDALTASIHDNGKSLDLNTEKGRANQSALDALAVKAAEAADAVYKQTGSASAAAATFARYRDAMVNAYMSMGKSRAEAEALTNSLMALPRDIPITVTTRYITKGKPSQTEGFRPGNFNAEGSVTEYFDRGGFSDSAHVAQIAPAGSWRVWGEPETGGEGYIPLAESKRARSTAILADINRRFGNPLGGGTATAVEVNPTFQVTLQAGDPLGQALLGMVDVQIQRVQTRTARAVATGVRT